MENLGNERKTCFIITPIGNEKDSIRRHIDGIVDAVLIPILKKEEYDYEPIVAHRINKTGSINKQVISGIYEAKIIIANLTELNPNVMYELAFAHSIGKPTIMIAEDGTTKLPFDIANERTIFYKNDFKGCLELKERIETTLNEILGLGENQKILDNPIYTFLDRSIYEDTILHNMKNTKIEENVDAFKYMIDRLDQIETKLSTEIRFEDGRRGIRKDETEIIIFLDDNIKKDEDIEKAQNYLEQELHQSKFYSTVVSYGIHGRWFRIITKLVGEEKNTFINFLNNIPNWKINRISKVV